ncbi:hypothetical protein CFC21_112216 [Triticum aestivum]|uniref:Uncharacterized protein n=2 Tax=Triticum aestivum TaxID=4565 RepID=A0A9R0G4C1_WHEAT|nr:hypothetical protein CFC21_098237 [Triticum aestivum]MBC2899373.1 hypothetical protein [Triticum aestivum]
MVIFKKKAGALFLATLMVMATLLSSCEANNKIQTDALPLPSKCYELDLPNCTLESCKKFCAGGKCSSYDGCCCPIA